MHLVVRPLILSEAESNLIVIDYRIYSNRKAARFAVRSPLLSLLFKCLATKHTTITGSCPSLQLSSRGQLISYKNIKKRKQQQQQLANHEQLTSKKKKKKKEKKALTVLIY